MPLMLQRNVAQGSRSRDRYDFSDPVLDVYATAPRVRAGLLSSQFWRVEIQLERTTQAFLDRSTQIPWREVDFDLEDRGLKQVNFKEYVEDDDDFTW